MNLLLLIVIILLIFGTGGGDIQQVVVTVATTGPFGAFSATQNPNDCYASTFTKLGLSRQ